jgi:hypothetical protein
MPLLEENHFVLFDTGARGGAVVEAHKPEVRGIDSR